VSGLPLADFSQDELFDPLGLERTQVRDDPFDVILSRATGYEQLEGGYEIAESLWLQTGDGAVHSTAGELVEWSAAFLPPAEAEGGVGSRAWLDLVLEPGPIPDEDGQPYAAGLTLTEIAGEDALTHDGAWLGFSSSLTVLVDEGTSVAVTCNIDDLDAATLAEEALAAWRS
jgi:CubicO group peptidase (beta-lactamase class C family)